MPSTAQITLSPRLWRAVLLGLKVREVEELLRPTRHDAIRSLLAPFDQNGPLAEAAVTLSWPQSDLPTIGQLLEDAAFESFTPRTLTEAEVAQVEALVSCGAMTAMAQQAVSPVVSTDWRAYQGDRPQHRR